MFLSLRYEAHVHQTTEARMKKLYLWSKRFSTAQGHHWKIERECLQETAQQWLEVFQKDEPDVKFVISSNKPRGNK
jgi:hypothetical protein